MSPTRRELAWPVVMALAMAAFAVSNSVFAQDGPPGGGDPGNVFISPPGRPFRAKPSEPYPVVNWFQMADTNGDGKLDHAEFIADSMAFFKILDRNGDDVISPQEVAFYEQRIAPEVLGMRVEVSKGRIIEAKPRLWRTQGMPGGQGPSGTVDPGAGQDQGSESQPRSKPYDASGAGASPYSFFDEPEPVAAADINFRGLIRKSDFLRLAEAHFATLDSRNLGYLTLDTLPETPVQRRLGHGHRRGR